VSRATRWAPKRCGSTPTWTAPCGQYGLLHTDRADDVIDPPVRSGTDCSAVHRLSDSSTPTLPAVEIVLFRPAARPGDAGFLTFEVDPRRFPFDCRGPGRGTRVGDAELNGTLCLETETGVVWPTYNPSPPRQRTPRAWRAGTRTADRYGLIMRDLAVVGAFFATPDGPTQRR
jgi:hypothetical protein